MKLLFISLIFLTGCCELPRYQMPDGAICNRHHRREGVFYDCDNGFRYIKPDKFKVLYKDKK